ncbi:NrtR-regulated protein [Minicystis rosea]|nr:NrtR-regulated protein [Minicystis rosea]
MSAAPRVVTVTRPTDYEALLARHGTREQARFFLSRRDQSIDEVEGRHKRFEGVLARVSQAIPVRWRRTRLRRGELSRFVFEPDDVVVVIGQDGLVPNVAKYLDGQRVIGINPDPALYDGLLVRHRVEAIADLLADAAAERCRIEERTMVEAKLDDGQRLLSLNEIFVGQRTHQSARYRIRRGRKEERQSSSGLIVATGTGATGWARSIQRDRRAEVALPKPTESALSFFVREAFPSVATGTTLTEGRLGEGEVLCVTSEMNDDGVVFGDGIEEDRLTFGWGVKAEVMMARERLRIVA